MAALETATESAGAARRPWRAGPRGLFAKYALSLVGLVVLVLAVNGSVEGYIVYREALARIARGQKEAAQTVAVRAGQLIKTLERQASFVTRAGAASLEERRRDNLLLLKTQSSIRAALVLDRTGARRLSIARAGDDPGKPPQSTGDARQTRLVLVPQAGGRPALWMLMPHAGADSDLTALRIDPDALFSPLLAIPRPAGSELSLRDAEEQVVWRAAPAQGAREAGPVLGARAALDTIGWTANLALPAREALRPVEAFALRFAWLLAFGSTLALLVSLILSRRMIEPIRALRQGARRFAEGALDHRIALHGGEELEDLAAQFNRMAGELGGSYARLEREVEARTAELARSVCELEGLEEAGRAMSASLERDAVLTAIAVEAVRLAGGEGAALYTAEAAGRYKLARQHGLAATITLPAEIQPGQALVDEAAVASLSIASMGDEGASRDVLVAAAPLRSALIAALKAGGEADALLFVFFPQAVPDTSGALQTFAHHAALALRNARLFEDVTAQRRELAHWNETLESRVAEQMATLERLGRLERFLAPHVAALVASGEDAETLLASHRREVTVVFCDLRGFTAFTDAAEPEDVMGVLQAYHSVVGETVFQHEGVIEHFAGDGIMILFNDPVPCPEHALRAVKMALALRDKVSSLTADWSARGYELGLGIGIAAGYATLGQVGFERRREYTAIGSVTNLAARLCDEARPGQIVISRPVLGRVEAHVAVRPLGELALKGFARAMAAYEVRGLREDADRAAG